MATITFDSFNAGKSGADKSALLKSVNAFLDSVIASRQKSAQNYIDNYLRSLDASQLEQLEFTKEEIKQLKSGVSYAEIR